MTKSPRSVLVSWLALAALVPACGGAPLDVQPMSAPVAQSSAITIPPVHWPLPPIIPLGSTYTTFYASDDGMMFARDHGANGWRTWYNFSSLGWDHLSYPGAASWGGGRMDVFNIDTGSNTMLHTYVATVDGPVSMDNWGNAPGYTFFGKPDASSWGDQRIDVVCAARDSAGRTVLLHKAWDHGRVYGWESYGAAPNGMQLSGAVTATSWGPSRTDVFALTTDSPPHLVHTYTNTGAPGPWEDWSIRAGVTLEDNTNGIDVASWGSNRLDLFALDVHGVTQHMWWDNGATGWDTWGNPSTSALGRVSVVSTEARSLIVSVQDSSGPQVWEDAWIGGGSPWRNTGLAPEADVPFVGGGYDMSHW
jgi:hypothetical protein